MSLLSQGGWGLPQTMPMTTPIIRKMKRRSLFVSLSLRPLHQFQDLLHIPWDFGLSSKRWWVSPLCSGLKEVYPDINFFYWPLCLGKPTSYGCRVVIQGTGVRSLGQSLFSFVIYMTKVHLLLKLLKIPCCQKTFKDQFRICPIKHFTVFGLRIGM